MPWIKAYAWNGYVLVDKALIFIAVRIFLKSTGRERTHWTNKTPKHNTGNGHNASGYVLFFPFFPQKNLNYTTDLISRQRAKLNVRFSIFTPSEVIWIAPGFSVLQTAGAQHLQPSSSRYLNLHTQSQQLLYKLFAKGVCLLKNSLQKLSQTQL